MHRNAFFALIAGLLVAVVLLLPAPTEAVNLFGDACSQDGAQGSAACSGTGTSGSNPIVNTLNRITVLVAVISGVAAVLLLGVAGFLYATANGDSGKIETAKNTVIYTVVGLFIIVFARVIIGFVISNIYD